MNQRDGASLADGRRRFAARLLGSACVALSLPPAAQSAQAGEGEREGEGERITVSAAASLGNVFEALAAAFREAAPGRSVRLNLGASGALLQQIRQGAPVDVFASADDATMDRGMAASLFDPDSRVDFATNRVVLIEPARDGAGLGSLADLERPGVRRIAIGKVATVPAGRYAREALEAAGIWARLGPKLVHADSVRQVLDYVRRGEVAAGFVYATDAAVAGDSVRVSAVLTGHTPVTYPAAVVRASDHKGLAGRFVVFLTSPPAREILARHGFGLP